MCVGTDLISSLTLHRREFYMIGIEAQLLLSHVFTQVIPNSMGLSVTHRSYLLVKEFAVLWEHNLPVNKDAVCGVVNDDELPSVVSQRLQSTSKSRNSPKPSVPFYLSILTRMNFNAKVYCIMTLYLLTCNCKNGHTLTTDCTTNSGTAF